MRSYAQRKVLSQAISRYCLRKLASFQFSRRCQSVRVKCFYPPPLGSVNSTCKMRILLHAPCRIRGLLQEELKWMVMSGILSVPTILKVNKCEGCLLKREGCLLFIRHFLHPRSSGIRFVTARTTASSQRVQHYVGSIGVTSVFWHIMATDASNKKITKKCHTY